LISSFHIQASQALTAYSILSQRCQVWGWILCIAALIFVLIAAFPVGGRVRKLALTLFVLLATLAGFVAFLDTATPQMLGSNRSGPAGPTPPNVVTKAGNKQLPKDFAALLEHGDIDQLKAVFDVFDVNARSGYGKQTALAFDRCPDELARWLVAHGADLSATDIWGNTPLHQRARSRRGSIAALLELGADVNSASSSIGTPLHAAADSHNAENARLLLQSGARVDAVNREGLTPLELALRGCNNIDIEHMVQLANVLLDAGAKKTPRLKEFVTEIGKRFEFHRSGFNPEYVDSASSALDQLYVIFDTPSVPRRVLHDGKSPIAVTANVWTKQHEELWELLVPSSGPAATIQGEVIRISGRISDELYRNGGGNWDAGFNKMADAFLQHVRGGTPLSTQELREAETVVAELKRTSGDSGDTRRLSELAVKWVLQNPQPIKLEPPNYDR